MALHDAPICRAMIVSADSFSLAAYSWPRLSTAMPSGSTPAGKLFTTRSVFVAMTLTLLLLLLATKISLPSALTVYGAAADRAEL